MKPLRFILVDDRVKRYAIEAIKRYSDGEILEIIIKEYVPKRSVQQNRLYWGLWLKEISSYTGYEEDCLHELFRSEFLPHILGVERESELFGLKKTIRHSTTDCTVKQFTDYLERIERFANTEIGITLSHPEDLYYAAMGFVH